MCVCVCVRSAVWQGAKRLVPHNEVRMRRSCRNPETKDARRETEHDDDDDDDDDNVNMGVSGPRGHHFGVDLTYDGRWLAHCASSARVATASARNRPRLP